MAIFYLNESSIHNYLFESGGVRKKIAQNYMTNAKTTGNGSYIVKAMDIAHPSSAKKTINYEINDPNDWDNVKEVESIGYTMNTKKGKPYELSNKTPNFKSKSSEEQKAIVDEGRRRKQEIHKKYYK